MEELSLLELMPTSAQFVLLLKSDMLRGSQERAVEFGTVPLGKRMKGSEGSLGHGCGVREGF